MRRIERVFGASDPRVVSDSIVMKSSPIDLVDYAAANASFGLYCCVVSDREIMVVIEPRGRDSRSTCQVAWGGIRRALGRRVKLVSAALVDPVSAEEVLHGRVGLGAQLRRSAIYQPIIVGSTTAIITAGLIYLLGLRGQNPPQTAYLAAIPGIVNAVWFLGVAVRDWSRRTIQWA